MDKTIAADEREFARMIFQALSGITPSDENRAASNRYWSRNFDSPWQQNDDLPTSQYASRLIESLQDMGAATSLRERWAAQFDNNGYPKQGSAREFVADFLQTIIHFRRDYHQFNCQRQRVDAGHVMDFPIQHPVAVDFWTVYGSNNGQGILSSAKGSRPVMPQSIVIVPPGQQLTVQRSPDSQLWDFDLLNFRSKAAWLELLDWTFSLEEPAIIEFKQSGEWELTQHAFRQLERTPYISGDLSEHLCFNLIENLLIRLRLKWIQSGNEINTDQRLTTVANHLLMHYAQDESLHSIAKIVGLSESRLNALFREHFGTSVMKWRDTLRLQKAKELLAMTELSVSEVAAQTGYDDPLYFSRRFKQQFGLSPRASRKSQHIVPTKMA